MFTSISSSVNLSYILFLIVAITSSFNDVININFVVTMIVSLKYDNAQDKILIANYVILGYPV